PKSSPASPDLVAVIGSTSAGCFRDRIRHLHLRAFRLAAVRETDGCGAVLGDPAPRPQPTSTGTPARQRARDWAGTGQQETRESAGEEGILSLWTRPASHISPQRTGKVTLLEEPCEPRIPDQDIEGGCEKSCAALALSSPVGDPSLAWKGLDPSQRAVSWSYVEAA
ncbi:hypothetical protein DBR06_SOUSAS310220, partial [Sousa chinensis]